MGDWAESEARSLLVLLFPSGHTQKSRELVARHLRQARLDALEEAAHLFDGFGDDPFTASSIAAAIRALKEKQP